MSGSALNGQDRAGTAPHLAEDLRRYLQQGRDAVLRAMDGVG